MDDLPYLSIRYNYTLDKVLSDQPMALSFSVGSGSAATASLDKTVTLGEQTLHITELRYSALGLSLRMSTGMEAANALYDDMPVVHLRDGTTVGTYLLMGSGNAAERADLSFSYVDKDGGRIFPDASQIVSISIGGTVIWTR